MRNAVTFHLIPTGYTDLSTSVLSQRQSVEFRGSLSQLEHHLYQLSGDIETVKSGSKRGIRVFKAIDILLNDDVAVLEVAVHSSFNSI